MKLLHAPTAVQKSARPYLQEIWLLRKLLVNYQLSAVIVLMNTPETLLRNMKKNCVKKGNDFTPKIPSLFLCILLLNFDVQNDDVQV